MMPLCLLIELCKLIKFSLCSAVSLAFLMSLQNGQLSLYILVIFLFFFTTKFVVSLHLCLTLSSQLPGMYGYC